MDDSVIASLSEQRFDTFLKATGFDRTRALLLCLWNARIGGAFYPLLQAVEIAMRNHVACDLADRFGDTWWVDPDFQTVTGNEQLPRIMKLSSRLGKRIANLEPRELVSGLSFGFWVALLRPACAEGLWQQDAEMLGRFRDPGERRALFEKARATLQLRNRIAHHEPLIHLDVMRAYSETRNLLRLLCPATEAWIRPVCEVPKLVRQKP